MCPISAGCRALEDRGYNQNASTAQLRQAAATGRCALLVKNSAPPDWARDSHRIPVPDLTTSGWEVYLPWRRQCTDRDDRELGRAIGRMLHTDDVDRLELLTRVAAGPPAPGQQVYAGSGRLLDMLHFSLWGPSAPLATRDERLARLWKEPARCAELRQVAEVLRDRIHRVTPTLTPGAVPLRVHARYSRNEACAAFGMTNPGSLREGVKWLPDAQADLFFVTLVKSEAHYSPTTMYADRAITDTLFQWESQSTTSAGSATGQRYTSGGSTVHLFVRETRIPDRDLGAPPYLYAGPMTYQEHTGDRPMRILWQLHHALPADMYSAARAIAA